MHENLFLMFAVSTLGFLITFLTIPFIQRIAIRHQIIAYPGGRRHHENPTPLLGGISIYIPFAVAFCAYYLVASLGGDSISRLESRQMLSLFLGTTLIHIVGTYDDVVSMGWRKKLTGQICSVVILLLGGHTVATATVPFIGPVDFGWFGSLLFVLSILAITNGINLIDGLDGLAGGICFFASLTSAVIGLFKGDLFTATVGFTITGSLLGFLRYNFPPASIYLGDGGSLMLGFVLGTLATSCAATAPGQRSGTMGMILIPFLPFGIALLDVILAVLRRWVTGRRIFLADSDHLHHRLMEKFGQTRKVAVIIYFFSGLLCSMTLALVLGPRSDLTVKFIAVSGTMMLIVVVAILKLYRLETLSKTLENRPHFQFLSSYHAFMSRRISRAESFDELISLLESGVRDLGCDSVEVFYGDRTVKKWTNPRKTHEGAPRSEGEKNFSGMRFHVRWVFPTHESESYQKYLMLTWYRVVSELEARLREFAEGSWLYEWMAEQRYALPNKYIVHTRFLAMSTDDDKARRLEQSSLPFYVISVNFSDYADLKRLSASLSLVKYLKRLIVVNQSAPRSPGELETLFPVTTIHQDNRGYAAALNRGLLEIDEPDAVTLLCAPGITVVNPEEIQEAVNYISQNPTIACLIPTLVDPKFRPVHSCRQFYTLTTLMASSIPWFRSNPPGFLREHFYMTRTGTEPFDVDWGCGSAMLFRNSFFPDPLSFDERFFSYFEDVDLCSRAWQEGLGVAYFPKLVCLHENANQGSGLLTLSLRHVQDMFRYLLKYRGLPNRSSLLS